MAIRTRLPESVKRLWWYCTDAKWRGEYRATQHWLRTRHLNQERSYCEIWRQTEGRIAAGPFRGVRYLAPAPGRAYPQKLLGTYELELWPIIEAIAAKSYMHVVDVGAGEGYYVSGLASRLALAQVVAFEAQRACHANIAELARSNGFADRISIRGICLTKDLRDALADRQRCLVICDIEGAEGELLDPVAIPALQTVDLLVEVHEHFRSGVAGALRSHFSPTHDIAVISTRARTIADLPAEIELDETTALTAMDEGRGKNMEWYWMTCKR